MADDTETSTDTPTPAPKAPRRRAPRPQKTATSESNSEGEAAAPKRARASKTTPKSADESAKPVAKRAPAKPRTAKRATPAAKRRRSAPSTVEKATEKVGGRWGAAAIAGGVAVVGAAAALLTLRGSTRTTSPKPASAKPSHAHTADGTDASKSFAAGIADENTIPDA